VRTKLLLAAAAAISALGLASAAGAATVLISADSLATSAYVVTLGGAVDGNAYGPQGVYESPDVLTVSVNGGPPEDILVFCVDIFHNFSSSTPPVTYTTAQVTHNSDSSASGGGTALSNLISGEIGYLAQLGQGTSDPARLAGIQGAIWQTEYGPTLSITGGSSYISFYATAAANWGVSHPNYQGYANGIYPLNGQTGGFGFTQGFTTGVPEPATWGLMIAGFGLAGGLLRKRRSLAATA
jgi:hypothetical protein